MAKVANMVKSPKQKKSKVNENAENNKQTNRKEKEGNTDALKALAAGTSRVSKKKLHKHNKKTAQGQNGTTMAVAAEDHSKENSPNSMLKKKKKNKSKKSNQQKSEGNSNEHQIPHSKSSVQNSKEVNLDSDSEDEHTDKKTEVDKFIEDFGFKDYFESTEHEEFKAAMKRDRETAKVTAKVFKQAGDDVSRTLCVDNVNIHTNKKHIDQCFKKYGKIESIRFRNIPLADEDTFKTRQVMKKNFRPGRQSMTAYVKFVDEQACKAALDAHMTVVCSHHLLCRPASGRAFEEVRAEVRRGKTVLVGRLNKNAEEEVLYQKFSPCGAIADIAVPRKRTNGTGVAFVTFHDAAAMPAALALTDTLVGPCRIAVSRAVRKVPKRKQHTGGRGGRGLVKGGALSKASEAARRRMEGRKQREYKAMAEQAAKGGEGAAQVPVKDRLQNFAGRTADQTKKTKKVKETKDQKWKNILAKRLLATSK